MDISTVRFNHKTASGDVWLVMQQASGSPAKLWYYSNGVDYSLLYDNFPCGSVTNSCMAWYEPMLNMIVYSVTTYQQAQPSVLHKKRTSGTWVYHNLPNVNSYLSTVKCIGYNTELSRYEAVIQDTRNNGVGVCT